jgi:hypothetical protein
VMGQTTSSRQPTARSPEQHRGAPCQARDCRCVRFEKFYASSMLRAVLPQQTETIIAATADAAAGLGSTPATEAELVVWRALQDWLRLGPRDVVVPYAPIIGQQVDRRALRIRRDFGGVPALTKASALLHRAQRKVDEQGRIIAELTDYTLATNVLGGRLEEVIHGDTAAIDQVRDVIAGELRRARRKWWRAEVMRSFRGELLSYLKGKNLQAASDRLERACLAQAARWPEREPAHALIDSVMGCVAVVTANGSDSSVGLSADPNQFDPVRLRLFFAAGKRMTKLDERRTTAAPGRPSAVELSSQRDPGVAPSLPRGRATCVGISGLARLNRTTGPLASK